MSETSPELRRGLACDIRDLQAAEKLAQRSNVGELQRWVDEEGESSVRERTRIRIAGCLDFLADKAAIDPTSKDLLQKIDDTFGHDSSFHRPLDRETALFYPDAQIYAVDDDPGLTRAYDRILSRAGYHVTTFNCPVEALEAITLSTVDGDIPHMVISDMLMPQMYGTVFLGKIRELPEMFQPSLAMISDRVGEDSIQQLAAAYDFDMASKPIDATVLRKLVSDGLQRHPVLSRVNRLLQIEEELRKAGEDSSDVGSFAE